LVRLVWNENSENCSGKSYSGMLTVPTSGAAASSGTSYAAGDGSSIASAGPAIRGLHSFPFQLNLSSSVHRMTQLKS
jgi:hypothetical protein